MVKAVCVASGKGGVGKSLISINIARMLAERGFRVGLIDADISNPTIFQLLNMTYEVSFPSEKRIEPARVNIGKGVLEIFSVESISRGRGIYKVGSEYAKILAEVVNYGGWTSDILVVDSPAGMGDVHKITVGAFDKDYAGTIIVGVRAHAPEVRRVLEVHRVNDIPVIGVIENMAGFRCECGREYDFFMGESLETVANEFGVPFLGSIPLDKRVGVASPWLPEDIAKPIHNAVEAIIASEPRLPGFLREIKEFSESVKSSVLKAIFNIVPALIQLLNKYVPIAEIQAKYNLPGGRVIALVLTEPDLNKEIRTDYFMVQDGKLVMLKPKEVNGKLYLFGKPLVPYAVIRVYYKALAWAIVGHKKDGTPYDFWTAFWNDHIRVSTIEGPENIQAWYFLTTCIEYAKQYSRGEIQKLVEVLL